MLTEILTWIGIALCVSQSAMFSGLNLAFFSVSRLRLEVEVAAGNANAAKVLALRQDPNSLLTTILLGNVAVNVLLTMLSDSVLAGVAAFLFSTVVITAFGEILPQAYFSRNALRVSSMLSPLFRFYKVLFYPIAKPVALLLDSWLGKEGMVLFREREMRHLIRKHIEASEADIDRIEGLGALNFLAIDDIKIEQEGGPLHPQSIVNLDFAAGGEPSFPSYESQRSDPFLRRIQASGEKWVVLVDEADRPRLVMDADGFLRDALFSESAVDPGRYCHRPIVVTDPSEKIGAVLSHWKPRVVGEHDVIDNDLILLWHESKRLITGADVLGRLLKGIAGTASQTAHAQ